MKRKIRVLLSSILAIALLYIFFRGTDFSKFAEAIKKANLLYLLGFSLYLPLYYFLRAVRWQILFPKGSYRLKTFFMANIIGFSINYLLPGRVGEIGRALYVGKKGKNSSSYSLGTVVVERFFDAFSVGLLLLFYVLLYPVRNGKLRESLFTIIWVTLAASILLIIGIILVEVMIKKEVKAPFYFLLNLFPKKLREKIKNSIKSLIYGMNFLKPLSRALYFVFWGIIVWSAVAFQYWLGLRAFSINRPSVELIPFTAVLLVGASIPTPAMTGGFEVASKFFLVEIWHYNSDTAVAATLTLHFLLLLITLSMGAAVGIKETISLWRNEK